MSRASITYADGGAARVVAGAVDVSEPVAGFYRLRVGAASVKGAVRIWHGPPHDPVTGEELDRSWRWQATFNGDPIDFDRVWPACAKDTLSEQEYEFLIRRREWAKKNAPDSSYANTGRKRDPLSLGEPLPF